MFLHKQEVMYLDSKFLFKFMIRSLQQLRTALDPSFGIIRIAVEPQFLQPSTDGFTVPFNKGPVWPITSIRYQ
jgi:hypothetical protein